MPSNFDSVMKRLSNGVETLLDQTPTLIAGMAVRHYRDSFRNSGFTDESLVKWAPLKKAGTTPLVRTGALRGSIRPLLVSRTRIVIGSDRSYGSYHQYGQGVTPRPFMGYSNKLNNSIRAELFKLAKKLIPR